MKNIFFSVMLFFISANIFAQKDCIDSIAKEGCNCVEEKISDGAISKDNFNMELGLCFIDKSMQYKTELLQKYNIDLDNFNGEEGKKLGKLVGIKMVTICPNVFSKMSKYSSANESSEADPVQTTFEQEGTIQSITKNQFYTVYILDENFKQTSFLWLYDFNNSSSMLRDVNELRGKKITITYQEIELFDANVNEARKFKVIDNIEWE